MSAFKRQILNCNYKSAASAFILSIHAALIFITNHLF